MATDKHLSELLAGYALDCLDEEELIEVSEHLAVCQDCRTELQAYQSLVDRLGLAVSQAQPAPAIKRRLLKNIQSAGFKPAKRKRPTAWLRWITPIWAAVSLLLIVLLGVGTALLWQRVGQLETETQTGHLRVVNLSGTQVAPVANALLIFSEDGLRGTLVVDDLPPLDALHQYQLWLIEDGQRNSGAVFSVDEDGYGTVPVTAPSPLTGYSAFGVSIEPTGGSPAPTGKKVLGGDAH